MATLHVLQGPDKGKTFEVLSEPLLLGRHSEQIPLTDNTASRRHARMWQENGAWFLEDLDSANGTFVNGVRLTAPMKLKRGDQIKLGSTLLVLSGAPKGESLPGSMTPREVVDLHAGGGSMDSAIISSIPSNEDSVVIAAPETVEAARSWRIILDLIDALNATMSPDEMLQRVLDIIFEHVIVDRGFILLREQGNDGELVPVAVRYANRPAPRQERITTSHTIINHVLEHKESVICSNAMTDERFGPDSRGGSIHAYGLRSVICAPILARDRLIGIIHIDSSSVQYTYGTEQLRLVNAIAAVTGMALENARLVQSLVVNERLAAAGETVALLSHSIKNVLQGLHAGTDMVGRGLDRKDLTRIREGWEMIDRNLNRIYNLSMNMLAFSKEREPRLVTTQINKIIEDGVETVHHLADQRKVMLLTDLDEKMPPIPADADGLQQVILNLVSNAVEAVNEGEGRVVARTEFEPQREIILITVTDNGPGIPTEHIQRVFEPFYSTKGQGGTGLGLAVAKKIIEEHRGRINVTSTLGKGTTFEIQLPAGVHRWTPDSETQDTIHLP